MDASGPARANTRRRQEAHVTEQQLAGPRLSGKVAVVTGAGRGIGRAYAHALAAEGAAVVVNDLSAPEGSPAQEVVAELEAAGGRAVADHGSVTDFAAVERMMNMAIETFGRLDILIANAGISRPQFVAEARESDWADVTAVHCNGTFNCIRHAAPLMAEQGGGTIVTTGDITTGLYFPKLAAYRAAKAAVAVLTLYTAHELVETGINVNSVMPPATDTQMMRAFYDSLGGGLDDFMSNSKQLLADQQHEGPSASAASSAPPEAVPPLGVYLSTQAGRAITGRLFKLYGNEIRVVLSQGDVSSISPENAWFSVDELERRVPSWLAEVPAAVEVGGAAR
jgi:NAD(P)-dependent dehydrogenase (short-subunit alcohol dehydrogenase family)